MCHQVAPDESDARADFTDGQNEAVTVPGRVAARAEECLLGGQPCLASTTYACRRKPQCRKASSLICLDCWVVAVSTHVVVVEIKGAGVHYSWLC